MFDLVAFDADDTLWHNERLYQTARVRFNDLLEPYGLDDRIGQRVHEIEMGNLPHFGYGVMSFVLSLIEASIDLTSGRIRSEDIGKLLDLAREMLAAEVELLDGVPETLQSIASGRSLVLITKGDLLHQQKKIDRSGLRDYFKQIEVVSDKTPAVYAELLKKLEIDPSRFLMIGNSMRSDILPVLKIGGCAIHVPAKTTWQHEQASLPNEFGSRCLEAASFRDLPELIEKLERDRA